MCKLAIVSDYYFRPDIGKVHIRADYLSQWCEDFYWSFFFENFFENFIHLSNLQLVNMCKLAMLSDYMYNFRPDISKVHIRAAYLSQWCEDFYWSFFFENFFENFIHLSNLQLVNMCKLAMLSDYMYNFRPDISKVHIRAAYLSQWCEDFYRSFFFENQLHL